MTIEFFVPGEPRAKQSFRASSRGGGFQTARVKSWEAEVGWAAQQEMRREGMTELETGNLKLLTGDLAVYLEFHLKDARRVDCENLAKAVNDGLQGICFENDDQIVDLHIKKFKRVTGRKTGTFVRISQQE